VIDKLNDMTIEQLLQQADIIMANLHFVRADWFYAFIPLALFLLLSYWKKQDDKNWLPVIDEALLPFVLTKSSGKRRRYPLILVFIAASLCITALAGPVYKKLPQPVFREVSSLAVLLDLSQSMNATDIKPSRLVRAKLELLDILKLRKAGQTALVVYAADAFVVTPLTDDNATIANLVPSLTTEMMPAQGSNLSIALAKTSELFNQAGINKGDILLITDDIHEREQASIEKIVSQGHRLSIFGIGTAEGAPIPLDESLGGGFLLDRDGAIVIPRVDSSKLQSYALSGGGLYTGLDAGDSDVNKLARLFESSEIDKDDREDDEDNPNENLTADVWQEEGHWLLLPLLFFAALWARRGWLAVLILFTVPFPPPVYAATAEAELTQAGIIDSTHLWSTPDQKAMRAFEAGDNKKAAEQFTDPDWKASALYREGNYQATVDVLKDTQHSDGFYNKGNALANLGRYDEAIKAYDKALELDPENADAAHNREQVEQARKQQEQQQENQQGQQQDEQQSSQQDQQQQDKQQQDQQSKEQSQQDQQQQDQQNSGESSSDAEQDKQQGSEQQADQKDQQMEDEELKQRDAEAEKQQQQQEQLEYQQQQPDQQQDEQSQENTDEQQAKGDEEDRQQVEHDEPDDQTDNKPQEIEVNPMEASITEEEKATEQWLKRIPDDPGGLLRRKFLYQYNQTQNGNDEQQPW
jgi:Ca-activated chloride channel family protein